jgi:hypothetical protein
MSVICKNCGHVMANRDNVYGTICIKCNSFIPADKRPQFVIEAETLLKTQQNTIRNYLRRKTLGDNYGNKIE